MLKIETFAGPLVAGPGNEDFPKTDSRLASEPEYYDWEDVT